MAMPFAFDQVQAEERTHAIRMAIAEGDLSKARILTHHPAFVYLCYKLDVHTRTALSRLIEANARYGDPAAS
ncbi:MAG: hypothetical protein QGD93_10280 [Actinomycetota bacterium]|nr:hypothetical protein [Actinomycetota bacterium]